MFTGIVEELGRVRERTDVDRAGAAITRFSFEAPKVGADAAIGDSIAVNGCCLTVVDLDPDGWAAEATAETLARTDLASLAVGDTVNLERPVRLMDRLGGHLVQGHVDGTGSIVEPAPDLVVRAPAEVLRYLVPKGSVTVSGISLTVVDLVDDTFSVAVIPHTTEVTTLGRLRPGDPVNLEVDVIAKYAERLLAAGATSPYRSAGATGPSSAGDVPFDGMMATTVPSGGTASTAGGPRSGTMDPPAPTRPGQAPEPGGHP